MNAEIEAMMAANKAAMEDNQEEADCNCNTNSSKTSTVFLFVFIFVFVLMKLMMKNTKITIFREKKFTQMKTYILS